MGSSASSVSPQTDASPASAEPATVQTAVRISTRAQPARQRRLYERMNQQSEQLRREVIKTNPDPAVVADLKAKLRSLAS